jgi:hypothetical protein
MKTFINLECGKIVDAIKNPYFLISLFQKRRLCLQHLFIDPNDFQHALSVRKPRRFIRYTLNFELQTTLLGLYFNC